MRFFITVFVVLFILSSCNKEKNEIDVSNINIDLEVERYEVDFYKANNNTLKNVKKKYPYLFPEEFSDSLALIKIQDKEEQELFNETQKIYKDFSKTKKELEALFKHVKFYNPKFKYPKIITIISNIEYDSKVIYADSLLLISLDVYLGKNHKFYADFPKYIKENNTKEHIVVDVANEIIKMQTPISFNRSFINKIIFEGKKLYLLDKYLPNVPNNIKIGYSSEKLDWAQANEEQIWKYFIEKNLLYSTDTKLNKRFIENAPFSKFYLEQDNLSPGRIGVWVGWQIVQSYMKHNDVSLQELLQKNEQELFNESKYKPKK